MGAYLMLAVLLALIAGLGMTLRHSYVTEHHKEKNFGPAVLTVGAWLGVAFAMTLALIAYIIMRTYGLMT